MPENSVYLSVMNTATAAIGKRARRNGLTLAKLSRMIDASR